MRKSLAAAAAALTVTAGLLSPAGPALAVEDAGPAVTAETPRLQALALNAGAPAARGASLTVGSQPAPQQLTFGPAVYVWSANQYADPTKVFNLSGYSFTGATISLQRLTGGVWTTVKTTPVLKKDSADADLHVHDGRHRQDQGRSQQGGQEARHLGLAARHVRPATDLHPGREFLDGQPVQHRRGARVGRNAVVHDVHPV